MVSVSFYALEFIVHLTRFENRYRQMDDSVWNFQDLNLLITDLDLALVYMHTAMTSADSKIRKRNLRHAREVCDNVPQFVPRLALTGEELQILEHKLFTLKRLLDWSRRCAS